MSARCGYALQDYDPCGEPADEVCEDCDADLCLEHTVRTASGGFKCPDCAEGT